MQGSSDPGFQAALNEYTYIIVPASMVKKLHQWGRNARRTLSPVFREIVSTTNSFATKSLLLIWKGKLCEILLPDKTKVMIVKRRIFSICQRLVPLLVVQYLNVISLKNIQTTSRVDLEDCVYTYIPVGGV